MSKDNYICIPETYTRRQLNTLYREIPLKDTTSRTLRKYFCAMANLYGIITLKEAWRIISKQSPTLVTEEEFLAFAEIARHECEDYYLLGLDEIYINGTAKSVWEREIIDTLLFDKDMDLYHKTLQKQQGKPYFVPEKKQFLCYDKPFYCEDTPEALALKAFLAKAFPMDDGKLDTVFCDILYATRCRNADFLNVVDRLQGLGLEFSRESDFREFVEIYQKFHNHTRLQCNRGYTPDELFQMTPPEDRFKSISLGPNIRKSIQTRELDVEDFCKQILTMEMPSEAMRYDLLKQLVDIKTSTLQQDKKKKVGRNDPCPCGSGKKYKKCCGR